MPFVLIIAGPNGAGKTSFARRIAVQAPEAIFVNADEIARNLPTGLRGGGRNLRAGRDMINLLQAQIDVGADIILETTLATRRYLTAVPIWRAKGYDVDLYYLRLPDAEAAISRVRRRVATGGHNIPPDDIRRRYERSLTYFEAYKPIVNAWYLFDSMEGDFDFVLAGENHGPQADAD